MADTLILRRTPPDAESYDVIFGAQKVGNVYESGGVWHWRVYLAMPEEFIDRRGRTESRDTVLVPFDP